MVEHVGARLSTRVFLVRLTRIVALITGVYLVVAAKDIVSSKMERPVMMAIPIRLVFVTDSEMTHAPMNEFMTSGRLRQR